MLLRSLISRLATNVFATEKLEMEDDTSGNAEIVLCLATGGGFWETR